MISRIWRAFALQPHRVEDFKLSKDPLFIEKVRDIVGLYLDPPDRALVLCVDEKSADSGARSQSAAVADAPRTGRASMELIHPPAVRVTFRMWRVLGMNFLRLAARGVSGRR
jgi:hypothetical protein